MRKLALRLGLGGLFIGLFGVIGVPEIQAQTMPTETPTATEIASPTATATASASNQPLVAVAGGYGASGTALGSIEVFNPSTGTFSNGGTIETPVAGLGAATVESSDVLFIGGYDGTHYQNVGDLFAPPTSVEQTADMNTARGYFAIIPSLGGNVSEVLVAGGETNSGETNTAEVFNSHNGSWTSVGSMTTGRSEPAATTLADGRVLVCGGFQGMSYLATCEIYDPSTKTFAPTGSMSTARAEFTLTTVKGGSISGFVLAAGGIGGNVTNPQTLASTELYDPSSGTWQDAGNMINPRENFTATVLQNGEVLLAGGSFATGTSQTAQPNAELFDPNNVTFTATGAMNHPRQHQTATLLPDGRVVMIGGDDGETPTNTAEIYNAATGAFTDTAGTLAAARTQHAAALTNSGASSPTGSSGGAKTGGGWAPFVFVALIGLWTMVGLRRYALRRAA